MVGDADCLSRTHVRFGSKAAISACLYNVRFTPKSGHWLAVIRPRPTQQIAEKLNGSGTCFAAEQVELGQAERADNAKPEALQ